MRRVIRITMAVAIILALMAPVIAMSANPQQLKEWTIESTTELTNKNGEQYIRFIVKEDRELQGVKYRPGIPVMAFTDVITEARDYSAGDTLKAVVNHRIYNGRESYTILAFTK